MYGWVCALWGDEMLRTSGLAVRHQQHLFLGRLRRSQQVDQAIVLEFDRKPASKRGFSNRPGKKAGTGLKKCVENRNEKMGSTIALELRLDCFLAGRLLGKEDQRVNYITVLYYE